jgi:hypothetical protein
MNDSQKKLPGEPGSYDIQNLLQATSNCLDAVQTAAVTIDRLLSLLAAVTAFNLALVVYIVWFR